MEKRTDWGSEYSVSKRNGEWEYQAFLADGRADDVSTLIVAFSATRMETA
jgi:hypothetical protein